MNTERGNKSVRIGENIEEASWVQLGDTEDVKWVGRPSLFTLTQPIVVSAILISVGVLLYGVFHEAAVSIGVPEWIRFGPLALVILGVGWIAYALLDWLRLLYVITNEEIYVKYGLIARDVTQIRLQRVQNTSFEQSTIQRLFRFGDVQIFTAGTGTEDVTLNSIPRPERITKLLSASLRSQHANTDSPD